MYGDPKFAGPLAEIVEYSCSKCRSTIRTELGKAALNVLRDRTRCPLCGQALEVPDRVPRGGDGVPGGAGEQPGAEMLIATS